MGAKRIRRSSSPLLGTAIRLDQGRPTVSTKRRHAGLFEAIGRLDARMDTASRAELAAWIAEQYRTDYEAVPLGFVAVCLLGPPFVDHRLDLAGTIVEHYAPHDVMPGPFEPARSLARSGSCAFVEVFANGELLPIAHDGSVV